MLAGFAVAAVEAALGVLALPTGLAPYLFACAAATGLLAVVARRLLERPRDDPGDDSGGGPERGPDEPPPPPWWPDFEARFRDYARDRERPRQPVH
jgi:hypothetical protein